MEVTPEIQKRLELLRDKYAAIGQDLNSYLGSYSAENFPLDFIFTNNDGKLNISITGQGAFDLTPVSKHKFKLEEAGVELTFNPEENTLKFKQGPYEVSLSKK